MTISLTAAELEQLELALRTLLSPLDYATVDEWRSAVNRRLRSLFHADVAISVLPPAAGSRVGYSDELSPEQVAAYPYDDEGLRRALRMGLEVGNLEQLVAGDWNWYEYDPAVNGFYRPNRMEDFIGALLSRPERGQIAGLQLHRQRFDCEMFGEKGLAVMRLLLPAIRAGTWSALDWSRQRGALGPLLDQFGEGVLLYGRNGRVLHRNIALRRLLAEDPERERLYTRLLRLGAQTSAIGRRRKPPSVDTPCQNSQELCTVRGRYRLRSILLGPQWGGPEAVAVMLEQVRGIVPTDGELRERFHLTPRETQVARLLARGLANVEVAAMLGVSQHTAERHTEHVLMKVGVGTRAAVGAVLRGEADAPRSSIMAVEAG